MKTFYIDVYFLINFTTDILALYFAASLNKIKSSAMRLILAGAFGAAVACAIVLLAPSGLLFVSIFIIGILVTIEIFCPRETKLRKFINLFLKWSWRPSCTAQCVSLIAVDACSPIIWTGVRLIEALVCSPVVGVTKCVRSTQPTGIRSGCP